MRRPPGPEAREKPIIASPAFFASRNWQGDAIQGVFMMYSLWIAPLWGGGQPPPHKDLDCFVTSFLAMTKCAFCSLRNRSCGFPLTPASFTRLPCPVREAPGRSKDALPRKNRLADSVATDRVSSACWTYLRAWRRHPGPGVRGRAEGGVPKGKGCKGASARTPVIARHPAIPSARTGSDAERREAGRHPLTSSSGPRRSPA